jgi:hypothetical protein
MSPQSVYSDPNRGFGAQPPARPFQLGSQTLELDGSEAPDITNPGYSLDSDRMLGITEDPHSSLRQLPRSFQQTVQGFEQDQLRNAKTDSKNEIKRQRDAEFGQQAMQLDGQIASLEAYVGSMGYTNPYNPAYISQLAALKSERERLQQQIEAAQNPETYWEQLTRNVGNIGLEDVGGAIDSIRNALPDSIDNAFADAMSSIVESGPVRTLGRGVAMALEGYYTHV